MKHYPKHVGDYIKDTVGLSMLEDGAYNRLLDQYYSLERPLPLDRKACYRLARCTTGPERKAVDHVLDTYFSERLDGWHQKRIDSELAAFGERVRTAQENGKKNAARFPKGGPPDDPSGHRSGNQVGTDLGTQPVTKSVPRQVPTSIPSGGTNHKPVPINQEPETKNQEKAIEAPFGVINGGRPGQSASGPDRPPDLSIEEKPNDPARQEIAAAIHATVEKLRGIG